MEEKQDLEKITILKNKQEIFFDKISKLKKNIKITDKGIRRCATCGDFCMFWQQKITIKQNYILLIFVIIGFVQCVRKGKH